MIRANPFVERRKKDKQDLLTLIGEKEGVDKKKIIALFSFSTGLSTKVVADYWQELEDAGLLDKD